MSILILALAVKLPAASCWASLVFLPLDGGGLRWG